MYTLQLQRDFVSSHFLLGEGRGKENSPHKHMYRTSLEIEGDILNEEGFLIDILVVERELLTLVTVFENALLNNLSFFKDVNPSIENFAEIFCKEFHKKLDTTALTTMKVTIQEDMTASASYKMLLRGIG